MFSDEVVCCKISPNITDESSIDATSVDPEQTYQTLNIWLNIKNNSSRKRIKNWGMSCNRLCISMFVVKIWGQKVLSFWQIYISLKICVPEFDRNVLSCEK